MNRFLLFVCLVSTLNSINSITILLPSAASGLSITDEIQQLSPCYEYFLHYFLQGFIVISIGDIVEITGGGNLLSYDKIKLVKPLWKAF